VVAVSKLIISGDLLRGLLGLSPDIAIEDAQVGEHNTIVLSVWDRELPPGTFNVVGTTFCHQWEGQRWYRTVLGVVEDPKAQEGA
jgi:hypothetical protein